MTEEYSQLRESQVTLKDSFQTTAGRTLNCPSCDYSTTNKHYLRQHIALVHTTDRPFKCPFCDYAGKRSHALKEHLVVHSDERPYHCTQCNATFRKKGHLTNHYRMHSEAKAVAECKFCAIQPFSSHDKLYLHLRTVHKSLIGTEVFCCSRCTYASTNKTNCNIHETAHDDYRHVVKIKPKLPPSANVVLKCSACGFEASYKAEFEAHVIEKHMDDHTGKTTSMNSDRDPLESKYVMSRGTFYTRREEKNVERNESDTVNKCHQCGYKAESYKALIAHIVSHKQSDEGTYATVTYSKQPYQSSSQGSFTERNGTYSCNICGYDCESQRTIKAHMWRHSGHKNLQYPTFQNGPLSVYDGTLLAAQNFVDKDRESVRALFNQQKILPTESNNVGRSHVTVSVAHADVMNNNQTKVENKTTDESGPFPKVIVQKIHTPDQLVSCTVLPVKKVTPMDTTKEDGKTPRVIVQQVEQFSKPLMLSQYSNFVGPEERAKVNSVTVPTTSNSSISQGNTASHQISKLDSKTCKQEAKISSQEMIQMNNSERQQQINKDKDNPDDKITQSDVMVTAEKQEGTLSTPGNQLDTENPLQVMTAACEVVNRQPTTSGNMSSKRKINQEWSDTEQSAATLLSLLRQGPNINPVCHPFNNNNYTQPDKHMNIDVGAEEVVDSDKRDSESLDSGQTYETSSDASGRPKSGICSSLLAVIEQLREERCDDEDNEHSGTMRKKRKPSKSFSDVLTEEKYPNAEQLATVTKEGVVYRCKLCHYSSSAILMKQHMKMHKIKKPFECSLCDFVASCTSSLQDHMIQHCKTRQYQCKKCSAVFSYKSQLRAHSRVHDECQAFYCDHCDYVTSYIESYYEHLRLHSHSNTFTCVVCKEPFSDFDKLQVHVRDFCAETKRMNNNELASDIQSLEATDISDDVEKTVKCDQCDFVALSIRSLKSHRKRHVNDKRYIQHPLEQYKCNMCGYVCHHMPSLKSHMWKHAGETDFSYSFSDILSDGNPPLDKEGKPLITLRCCQCGYETINKNELNIHMKSHWDVIKKTFDVGK